MIRQDLEKFNLPTNPGVYFFLDRPQSGLGSKGEILYVGKATSLRDRVRSYFAPDVIKTRGAHIVDMVFKSNSIKFEETGSVLEALILEANYIKKFKPYYNTKEKDDKSFNYVCITNEILPRVMIERGKNIDFKLQKTKSYKLQAVYGPFINGSQLKEAMKIIRPIFPYLDKESLKKDNTVFYKQLGLLPEVNGKESEESYKKNINNLKLFFQGKKKRIISNFKKDMMILAKKREFEKANEIKKKIFSLTYINDIALIKNDPLGHPMSKLENFRIEAYDIAHMSGKNMVGVMVVLEDGEINKNEYRKFKIKNFKKANDAGALTELLTRRFGHPEWKFPDLIVVDGNIIQLNAAKAVLRDLCLEVPICSVVKDERHRPRKITGKKEIIEKYKLGILLANNEAHRFALKFHRERRSKAML